MQMVAVGLIIGVAVIFATDRLLQSELWGHDADRPMTFAGAILVTLAVGAVVEDGIAIAAVWAAAWRAAYRRASLHSARSALTGSMRLAWRAGT